ncbi:MAG: hypothetical protein R2713_11185 [Ilumatobacteraceae bacterium]
MAGGCNVRRKKDDEISWDDEIASPTEIPAGRSRPGAASREQRPRDRIARLETQMMAQYTAMAAYAQIAQNNTEAARAESRSDLDRSQSTVIGLIERVRRECAGDPGRGSARRWRRGQRSRVAALEERFDGLAAALEQHRHHPSTGRAGGGADRREDATRGLAGRNGNSEELSLH